MNMHILRWKHQQEHLLYQSKYNNVFPMYTTNVDIFFSWVYSEFYQAHPWVTNVAVIAQWLPLGEN